MRPARHYSDLIVWQLAEEIRIEVFRLTEKPRFDADFKARGQAEDAVNSLTRNIAEGFGCETHAEFARFLEISRRSLNELHDQLHGAQLKKYVSPSELAAIRQLSIRLYPAFASFIAYLRRTPNMRPKRGAPESGITTDCTRGNQTPKGLHRQPKNGTAEADRRHRTGRQKENRTDSDR